MPRIDQPLFPELTPYDLGWLELPGGHHIYYEQCGAPDGVPVVVLHGGPGSGCTPTQRRFFDPAHYRVILFDQRGCGRSKPMGCVEENTVWHLVEDIEALRDHLDIDRWLVFGGSWGSTLALAYATVYPQFISGMVLRGIFLSRPEELRWFLYQAAWFFPEAWRHLAGYLEPSEREDILGAYQSRIFGQDHEAAILAAHRWNTFEASIMSLLPATDTCPVSDEVSLARARVQIHYLANGCFLEERPLLALVDRFRHIPAVIVQGRYDMVCPPRTAFDLHQAWPEASFRVVPDAGHAASEPGIRAALIEATESYKHRVTAAGSRS